MDLVLPPKKESPRQPSLLQKETLQRPSYTLVSQQSAEIKIEATTNKHHDTFESFNAQFAANEFKNNESVGVNNQFQDDLLKPDSYRALNSTVPVKEEAKIVVQLGHPLYKESEEVENKHKFDLSNLKPDDFQNAKPFDDDNDSDHAPVVKGSSLKRRDNRTSREKRADKRKAGTR